MFELISATATVSTATLASMLASFARAKFTASILGPAGVGIFAQAFAFQQFAVSIATLGIGLGVTKYVSQYRAKGEYEKIAGVISCAFLVQVIASFAVVALSVLLSALLSKTLFSSGDYRLWLSVAMLGAPFLVLAVMSDTILLGFGRYKAFTIAKGLSAILALLPLFFFVYFMRLEGGFVYLAISGLIIFGTYYYFLYRNVPREVFSRIAGIARNIFSRKDILKRYSRDLLSYGGVSFVTGILSSASIVLLRALVIRYLGAEANGYYQVVFTLSAAYLPFFTNGLWSYVYPRISAIEDRRRYSVELNNAVRFSIFGVTPFIVSVFIFKRLIILAVFSEKFLPSQALFASQLFGDLFFLLYYLMGTSLLASARLKAYLIFGISYVLCFIGLFLAMRQNFGLKAVTLSYLITNAILSMSAIYYHIRFSGVTLYRRNITLLLSAVAVCGVVLFFGSGGAIINTVKMISLFFWMAFLSTRLEKKKAFSFLNKMATKGILYRHAR